MHTETQRYIGKTEKKCWCSEKMSGKKNPDELKLKSAAYSKAYRERKKLEKIEKFSNTDSEIESKKPDELKLKKKCSFCKSL